MVSARLALKRRSWTPFTSSAASASKAASPSPGAKNSALTLLPCALLTAEKLTLGNLPRLADVDNFSHLLNGLGASTKVAGVKKGEFGRKMTLEAQRHRLDRRAL